MLWSQLSQAGGHQKLESTGQGLLFDSQNSQSFSQDHMIKWEAPHVLLLRHRGPGQEQG